MAYDAFIKLDGVTGESQKANHKGEIEITSFSWGVSNPTTAGHTGGLASGKAAHADFSIVKVTDKSSPTLFLNCCLGKHFDKMTLGVQKATGANSGEVYLQMDFKNVFVTSLAWAGTGGAATPGITSDTPHETVSFSYEEVKLSYKPQDSSGKLGSQVIAGWSVATNSKI
jgi:type VI secretion system secreted protein Hcp